MPYYFSFSALKYQDSLGRVRFLLKQINKKTSQSHTLNKCAWKTAVLPPKPIPLEFNTARLDDFASSAPQAQQHVCLTCKCSVLWEKKKSYISCLVKEIQRPNRRRGIPQKETPEDQKIKYVFPPNQSKISSIILLSLFILFPPNPATFRKRNENTYLCMLMLSFSSLSKRIVASILFEVALKDFIF